MDLIFKFSQLILLIELVYGRGSMLNPPQRSSLWRFRPWKKDKDIPKNLEDYGLNCGGFWRLHGINKGKCGVCGDPYDTDSRQNEGGGKYANGIIVRRYRQHRKFINVTIDVTANIGGHFEFRLCPNNNVSAIVTQECLNKHRLTVEGHGLKFNPKTDKKYRIALNMPKNVTCKHCVLQWKWRGSYNWGRCDDGYQDLGCGNQEEYYNCADIAILPSKRRKKPKQQHVPKVIEKTNDKIIGSSKDVKIMSTDIKDIKTIDAILAEQTNKIDPVVSGIPVYMFNPEVTTRLPLFEPPRIVIGNAIHQTNGVISQPETQQTKNIGIPIVLENTIYDLPSTNAMNGIKQDLVQSPGDYIFNKANWISGTSEPVSGVGVNNASGDGNASALQINTNTSITIKPALNASGEKIGVLDATNDATLDPLTINRNVNILSDMFYGAMIAGGETELDTLLPLTFYPTVTEPQPYGDLANQFMKSVFSLKQQQKANDTIHHWQLTNQSGLRDNLLQSNSLLTTIPTVNPIITQEKVQQMAITTNNNSDIKGTISENNSMVSPLTRSGNTESLITSTASPQIVGVTSPMPAIINQPSSLSTVSFQSGLQTESPNITQQDLNSQLETTYQTTVHPWRDVLLEMNSLLNNLNSQLDGYVQGPIAQNMGTVNEVPMDKDQTQMLIPNVMESDALAAGNVKKPVSQTIGSDVLIAGNVKKDTSQQIQTDVNIKKESLQQTKRKILYVGNVKREIPKQTGQNVQYKGNIKKEIPQQIRRNVLYAGNVRTNTPQPTTQNLPVATNIMIKNSLPLQTRMLIADNVQNDMSLPQTKTLSLAGTIKAEMKQNMADGVVVSDVGETVAVQDQRPRYVVQPSMVVNGVDSSWGTLSQQPIVTHNSQSVFQTSDVYLNGKGLTTETPLDRNTPIIISDPKSNFSFQNLDARNVNVQTLDIATQFPPQVKNGIFVSEPLINQPNENAIISKPTVISGKQTRSTDQKRQWHNPKDSIIPGLRKSINILNELTQKFSNNVTDFFETSSNIIHGSKAKTKSLKSSPLIKDGTAAELAQNVLSSRTEAPKVILDNRIRRTSVRDMIRKPQNNQVNNVFAGNIPNWAANYFNGLYVAPTTPMNNLNRTPSPSTGVTESFLDTLSRMWGLNNNQGNAIF